MVCLRFTLLFVTFLGYVSAKGYNTGMGRPGSVQELIGADFGGGASSGYGGGIPSNLGGGVQPNLPSGLQGGSGQPKIGGGQQSSLGGGLSGYGKIAQTPLGGGVGPANRGGFQPSFGGGVGPANIGGFQPNLGGGRQGGAGEEKYPPRPFNMDYNVVDEQGNVQFRQEQGDGSGNVKGTYGYQDTQGLYRTVEYVAGPDGFKASVKTNEPGTDGKESPADTTFIVNPAPAGIQDQYTRQAGIGGGYNSGMKQGVSGIGGGLNAYGPGVGLAAGRVGSGAGSSAGRVGAGMGPGLNQGSGSGMKINKGSPAGAGSGTGGVPQFGGNLGTQSFGGPSGGAQSYLSQSPMQASNANFGAQGRQSAVSQGQGVKSGKSGY